MTLVVPAALKMASFQTCCTPPVSGATFTTTRLHTVWPATKLRSEAFGRLAWFGHMVRKLVAVAPVTVTLSTRAFGGVGVPDPGIPPTPPTPRGIGGGP